MRYLHLPIVALGLALAWGCGKKKSSGEEDPNRVVSAEMLIFDEQKGEVLMAGENVPFTGKAVWFHPNGQREQETTFVNGREDGPDVWWHPDGARAGQSHFKAGVLSGPSIQWHPGGITMAYQVQYLNGMKDGKEVEWHENGNEGSVTHFQNGLRQGRATGWFADGTKSWEAFWEDDEPHGRYLEWYESGLEKSEKEFKQGVQVGTETWWFENGQKSWETQWVDGRQSGTLTEWYETGTKMSETPYKAGRREGVATGWYANGQKAHETTYLDDEEIAVKEWNDDGTPVAAAPAPQGRLRVWAPNQIEQFYANKAEALVYTAFGEPDRAENGQWVYENILISQGATSVAHEARFTFKAGVVTSVKVVVPQTP